MKKILLTGAALLTVVSGSAMAADLTRPAPAPVYSKAPMMAPVFSWTGFYIGGNLGGAWAHHDWSDSTFGVNFSNGNSNGAFIGGGQVGFNYQVSNFVFGVEGDFDWAAKNNNGNGVFVPGLGETIQVTSNDTWISTVAARFGLAYDRVLFYCHACGSLVA